MKTTEYLWWVETIRQNEFRKGLPNAIISWVASSLFLISIGVYFLSSCTNHIFGIVSLVSLGVSGFSLLINISLSKECDIQLIEVKRIWEITQDQNKNYSKKLRYFYADDIKTAK